MTFLGLPGSGKGTQAERLSSEFKIPHIATGDILRNSIRKNTPLGERVKSYLETGRLVPDDVILELILEKVEKMGSFLMDGFPRTIVQAERLEETAPIDISVFFEISEATVLSRLMQRKICAICGKVYNLTTNPPTVDGVCDRCGANLAVREDDREVAVRRRLEVYKKETLPLVEYYSKKGVLKNIDAEGDPDEVYEKIEQILFENDNLKI